MKRVLVLGLVVLGSAVAAPAALGGTYIVLYKQHAVPADAAATVQKAGGTLVYSYPQIGVVIAQSESALFAANLAQDKRVEGATATERFAVQLREEQLGGADAEGPPPGDLPNSPAADADSLTALQWDMRQIFAPQAHAITGGSPAVVVGDLDTGLDKDHPDLVQNIDFSRSVSCEGGTPNTSPAAWDDHNGHGTHTAGTIAAAANGFGIVGVAPNVKVAGIKTSTDAGYFFPEAVVCAFMWAGTHQIDVTNNSYFADPYLFNCRNDKTQHAIWKAEQRAIRFAMQNGVTVVASEGNASEDLSHPTMDITSPDFPPGSEEEREVTNACVVIPVEIPGVIGVTANGHNEQTDDDPGPDYLKSYYSSYGVATADVVAPGGDSRFGLNAEAPNGRVLSTWPTELPCLRSVKEPAEPGDPPTVTYCYLQGTSMAGPHVAGVAALIVSRFGTLSRPNGKMSPGRVSALVQQTADPQPCPTALLPAYLAVTGSESGALQQCQGGLGHNSWYGAGQVNALRAVTHSSGN